MAAYKEAYRYFQHNPKKHSLVREPEHLIKKKNQLLPNQSPVNSHLLNHCRINLPQNCFLFPYRLASSCSHISNTRHQKKKELTKRSKSTTEDYLPQNYYCIMHMQFLADTIPSSCRTGFSSLHTAGTHVLSSHYSALQFSYQ